MVDNRGRMNPDDVTVVSAGAARIVTVHRAERRNALDPDTLGALARAARAIKKDRLARGIVLTGAPGVGVFLAGGDLRVLAGVRTAHAARAMALRAHEAVDALRAVGVPIVAAVHGDAFGGGCELAAACDYRVAEAQVRFHWVQARFAVTTGWGGTANLLGLVSRGTAMRWLLTARPVGCDEAARAGFVDEVVSEGKAVEAAVAFIDAVSAHPKHATARMLKLVRASGSVDAANARMLELDAFGRAWAHQDHHAAVARFLARR